MLIVAQQYAVQRPVLNYESSTVQQQSEGVLLDTYQGFSFWRMNVAVPLINGQPQAVTYWVNLGSQLGAMSRCVPRSWTEQSSSVAQQRQ